MVWAALSPSLTCALVLFDSYSLFLSTLHPHQHCRPLCLSFDFSVSNFLSYSLAFIFPGLSWCCFRLTFVCLQFFGGYFAVCPLFIMPVKHGKYCADSYVLSILENIFIYISYCALSQSAGTKIISFLYRYISFRFIGRARARLWNGSRENLYPMIYAMPLYSFYLKSCKAFEIHVLDILDLYCW